MDGTSSQVQTSTDLKNPIRNIFGTLFLFILFTHLLFLSDKSKFGYQIGETYRFRYEADTATSINGGNKDQSKLQFTATVLVEVLSKCELSLKVNF